MGRIALTLLSICLAVAVSLGEEIGAINTPLGLPDFSHSAANLTVTRGSSEVTSIALDVPEIKNTLVEAADPDPESPFGAKGIGEGCQLAPLPAIANAIYRAVGVRIKELPITPEKILDGLKD